MTVDRMLFCLLRNELNDEPLPQEPFSFQDPKLYQLAKQHDVSHLIADALIRNNLLPENDPVTEAYNRALMTAAYREIHLRETTECIRSVFNKGEIPFIPLKGTIMRGFYPEPWMRTSCDIDILVHESDIGRAVELLKENEFETDGIQHFHDISLFRNGVHLELHFNILEDMEKIDVGLAKVWNFTVQADGTEYLEQSIFFWIPTDKTLFTGRPIILFQSIVKCFCCFAGRKQFSDTQNAVDGNEQLFFF